MIKLCFFGYGYVISNLLNELDVSKYEIDIYGIHDSPKIYNDKINYFKIDFSETELKKILIKNYDIHLNAVGRAKGTFNELFQSNVYVNKTICDCIEKYSSSKKCIFLSTSAVYADKDSSIKESDLLCDNTDYAKTKIEIEKYILKNSSKCLILRPFNIYGNSKNINVEPIPCTNFITALENEEPLTFFIKDGQYLKRDIVSIKYFSEVLDFIMSNNKIMKTEIVNLGTGIITDYKNLKREHDFVIENDNIYVNVIADVSRLETYLVANYPERTC